MRKKKNPKLPLTESERFNLRKAKVKLSEIYKTEVNHLAEILNVSVERARDIKGLATFQQVPSIGSEMAKKLVDILHIYSLEEIKDKNGADLFDELERRMGVWTDPCVEDQIRCIIYFANNPASDKKWFDFTEERKQFRKLHGYPDTRPDKPWFA